MKTKQKAIVGNTFYTIAAALILNGVLQILIYPRLNADMGSEVIGGVLYITGLVSILGPSIGQALNTGRLVVRRDYDVSNGDYNRIILLFSAIGIAIALLISRKSMDGPMVYAATALLLLITIFRYYGDTEYRLSLNYKGYLIYYVLISVGYIVGYVVFRLGGSWFWIFLIGEIAGIVYLAAKGSIFRNFWKISPNHNIVLQKGALLVMSYFITNTTLNIDRLVLKNTLGGTAVTQYYVVSLIGKTLVLFIAPINTILISYMTKDKVRLTRKDFWKYAGVGLLVALVFWGLCEIGTPLFVRLFYPDLYASVKPLVTIVNLTQILGMLSAYLFMVVLTFTGEKWQLGLQAAHLAVVLILILLMMHATLVGFSVAVLIANILRIAAVLILGTIKSGGKSCAQPTT